MKLTKQLVTPISAGTQLGYTYREVIRIKVRWRDSQRRSGLIISCVVWDGLGFVHGRANRFASFRCREGQLER
jgi:hypothetical protein